MHQIQLASSTLVPALFFMKISIKTKTESGPVLRAHGPPAGPALMIS